MGAHLHAFFYRLKRKKYETMSAWAMRYRNEYTKVRRALARLQRAGEEGGSTPSVPEVTELETDDGVDGGTDGWWGRQ
eukprot:8075627-Alexandrium_andersonii.AAC.1